MNRRNFVKTNLFASGMFLVPDFLKPFEKMIAPTNRNIVIIQLSGGNDGLNTVIPFENDIYYNHRKTIGIKKNEVIKLNDQLGLNPAMQKLKEIYDQGYMSIINSVGYPNPDRSHFQSMDIWQTAANSDEHLTSGWVGRYLDSSCTGCGHSYMAIESDDALSLAMKGNSIKGLNVTDARNLYNETRDPFFKDIIAGQDAAMLTDDNLGYLYKTLIETSSSAAYIYETSKTTKNEFPYPNNGFAKQLKTIATFIGSNLQTKVYYVSLSGFDTHVNQSTRQFNKLTEYSEGLSAFINNLKQLNKWDDTLILTFSEFGRRVEQNASNGTDHGTASNVLVYGANLKKKGIVNEAPDLSDLDNGDLKYKIDFRSVYSTVLKNWLDIKDTSILMRDFPTLDFI